MKEKEKEKDKEKGKEKGVCYHPDDLYHSDLLPGLHDSPQPLSELPPTPSGTQQRPQAQRFAEHDLSDRTNRGPKDQSSSQEIRLPPTQQDRLIFLFHVPQAL